MALDNWQIPLTALGNPDTFRQQLNTILREIRDSQPGHAAALPDIALQRDGRLFVNTSSNKLYQAQDGAWVALT